MGDGLLGATNWATAAAAAAGHLTCQHCHLSTTAQRGRQISTFKDKDQIIEKSKKIVTAGEADFKKEGIKENRYHNNKSTIPKSKL